MLCDLADYRVPHTRLRAGFLLFRGQLFAKPGGPVLTVIDGVEHFHLVNRNIFRMIFKQLFVILNFNRSDHFVFENC